MKQNEIIELIHIWEDRIKYYRWMFDTVVMSDLLRHHLNVEIITYQACISDLNWIINKGD